MNIEETKEIINIDNENSLEILNELKDRQTELLIKSEVLDILHSLAYSGCCTFSVGNSSLFQLDEGVGEEISKRFDEIFDKICDLREFIEEKVTNLTGELVDIKNKIDSMTDNEEESVEAES